MVDLLISAGLSTLMIQHFSELHQGTLPKLNELQWATYQPSMLIPSDTIRAAVWPHLAHNLPFRRERRTPPTWEYRLEQLFPQIDGLPDHCSLGEPPPRYMITGPRFTPVRARLLLAMLPHLNAIRASMPATSSQWGMDPGVIPNVLLSTCGRIYNYHSGIVGAIWYTQAESIDRAQGPFPPLQLQQGGGNF